jgi:hypothetical protein
MGEESPGEPLTRRQPGENSGHQPAARFGSARLPEDVARRTLAALRAGAEAPEPPPAPRPEPPAPKPEPPAPPRVPPLGFAPGADASTQPIPVLPAASTATVPVSKGPVPRPRRYRVAGAGAAVAVAAILVAVAVARTMGGSSHAAAGSGGSAGRAAAVRGLAATWVAGQVSRADVISCDPVMCAALRAHGVPAARLLPLTGRRDPLRSAVIVATATVRAELGPRLAAVDAPAVIASFGAAAGRIQVRAVAPRGPAAYRAMLAADLTQRRESGAELLHSGRVSVSTLARAELAAGEVDARLLVTLAALAALHPVDVVSFGDGGPGASLTVSPYRSAVVTQAGTGSAAPVLAFLRAQRPPLAAALAQQLSLGAGRTAVRVEFAAPSPLGLLGGSGAGPPSP